jgi:serine/threonine-protein kinase
MMTAAPLVPMAVSGMARLRRLMRAGFTLDEARVALRKQEEQRLEELAFEYGDRPSPIGRIIRVATYAVAGATIVSLLYFIARPDQIDRMTGFYIISTGTISTLVGGILGTVFPGRTLQAARGPRSLRAWFWNSAAGTLAAKLVGVRVRRDNTAQLLQHPTEIAIGMAAQELFEALPAASRERVPDLPATLKRLEEEAQALRRRDDTDARARLASVVAALETLRLDLLKLHAGAIDVRALTEALQVAQRLGAEVDALVAGQQEAGALLASHPRKT